jgi:hypothetical protein
MGSESFNSKWSTIEHVTLPSEAESGFLNPVLLTDGRVSKIQAKSDLDTINLVENLLVNGKEYLYQQIEC